MNFEEAYYEAELFWEGAALADASNMARYELTGHLIPPDVRTLLDAGCGNGVFGRHLEGARPELRVTCMDRSATALKYVTTEKLQGNVAEIPARDASYDCVTCLEVIEHLPVGTYERALSELARVSRRYIVVSVPYRERIMDNVTRCPQCTTIFNVDLHLRYFDDGILNRLFDGLGFRHVASVRPPSSHQPVGLATINRLRGRLATWRNGERFASPVCPLCGYSEDAKAQSQHAGNALPASGSTAGAMTAVKAAVRSIARAMQPIWPHIEVQGYWTIYRYERS